MRGKLAFASLGGHGHIVELNRIKEVPVSVLQCPECELKFASESDLEQHLTSDHPGFHADQKTPDDVMFEAARRRRDRLEEGKHSR